MRNLHPVRHRTRTWSETMPSNGGSSRWRFIIGGWITMLVVIAIFAYSLSQARAEPRAVRIADIPNPSATIVSDPSVPTASPTAVSLVDVQRGGSRDVEDRESRISPTVAPVIVGAMLAIVFIAASPPRRF